MIELLAAVHVTLVMAEEAWFIRTFIVAFAHAHRTTSAVAVPDLNYRAPKKLIRKLNSRNAPMPNMDNAVHCDFVAARMLDLRSARFVAGSSAWPDIEGGCAHLEGHDMHKQVQVKKDGGDVQLKLAAGYAGVAKVVAGKLLDATGSNPTAVEITIWVT